jgi:quercetin dioxygenase-like cupin family protein
MVVKSLYPIRRPPGGSKIVPPAQTETIRVGALDIRFIVDADQSHGAVTVFECGVPADARVPAPHSHDAFEETIYGLQGVTTWTIDGETVEIAAGEGLCIARGSVHGFHNRGEGHAKFLAIATPGVFGPAYFQALSDVLAGGGPPDVAALGAVMRRHGLTPAPTPAG